MHSVRGHPEKLQEYSYWKPLPLVVGGGDESVEAARGGGSRGTHPLGQMLRSVNVSCILVPEVAEVICLFEMTDVLRVMTKDS